MQKFLNITMANGDELWESTTRVPGPEIRVWANPD